MTRKGYLDNKKRLLGQQEKATWMTPLLTGKTVPVAFCVVEIGISRGMILDFFQNLYRELKIVNSSNQIKS
ncbi:MAG: hypothetical protein ACR5K1_04290 [Wolbachia sp.]